MALTERLALLVTANTTNAVQGLVKVGATADKELGKVQSGLDRSAARLTKFGTGALLAGGIAAAGLYKAGQAASNLQQAVGGTESVFKEAAGAVDDFAKGSAQSVGLSSRAFRELTTVTGASLKGLGFSLDEAAKHSINLTKIGADLAATFGGTTEEAVAALGATLRGEFDPAEKFGVALSAAQVAAKAVELGLAKTTSQVDAHGKAQATLALIMERTADAQGAFAREADTAAGAQQRMKAELENLQASIGQAVLPVLTKLATVVGDAVGAFNSLPEPVRNAASQILAVGSGSLITVGAVAAVAGKVIGMRKNFIDAAESGSKLASVAVDLGHRLATVKLGELGKLGLEVGALVAFKEGLEHIAEAIDPKLTINMVQLTDSIVDLAQTGKVGGEAARVFGGDLGELADAIERIAKPSTQTQLNNALDAVTSLGHRFGFGRHDMEDAREQLEKLDEALASLATTDPAEAAKALDAVTNSLEAQGVPADRLVKLLPKYHDALTGLTTDQKLAGGAVDDTAEALAAQAKAAAEADDKIRQLNDAVKALFSANVNAEQAQIGVTRAVSDFAEATITANKTVDDGTTSVDEHAQAVLDMQSALLSADEAARGLADAQVKAAEDTAAATGATLSADEANRIYRASLVNTADTLAPDSPLRNRLNFYIQELDRTEGERVATITANVEGAIANIRRVVTSIQAMFGAGAGRVPLAVTAADTVHLFAKGGPVTAGRPVIVGEQGVEAFTPVPAYAAGGLVKAKPGGTMIRVAEAGKDEVVIPVDKPGTVASLPKKAFTGVRSFVDAVQAHEPRAARDTPPDVRDRRAPRRLQPAVATPPVKAQGLVRRVADAVRGLVRQALDTSSATPARRQVGTAPGPTGAGRSAFAQGSRLVGQHGPELFTPPTAGFIIPNHALKAAAVSDRRVPSGAVSVPPRAAGGPVRRDVTYLTGERGVERFMPSTSGWAIPPRVLAQAGAPAPTAPVSTSSQLFRDFVYHAAPNDPVSVSDAAKELRASLFRFGHD